MQIFNLVGSVFGYLLWALFYIFQNYGVAILFFTIITKAIMFPFSLKQQRSMASQSKMAAKQKELQEKYGKNREKYSEEVQKLYDKEGVKMSSGCLVSLLPMLIMMGIFYSIISPLSNTLHLNAASIASASEFINGLPGMAATGAYPELEVVKNFAGLREYIAPMFSAADLTKLDMFSQGFNFLGLNLLKSAKGSSFADFLWTIPVLSLVTQLGTQIYMQRHNKAMTGQQQQGCMMVMMYAMPLLGVYWSYQMPAAVGVYWVISGVLQFVQTLIMNKFFSANHMTAKIEAQRAVTLELAEENIRPLPAPAQKQIADRIAAQSNANEQKKQAPQQKQGKKKKK